MSELTLPHIRETSFLKDLIEDMLEPHPDQKPPPELVVIVMENMEKVKWYLNELWRVCEQSKDADKIRGELYRDAIHLSNGSKIIFVSYSFPSRLHGMRPDRIIVMGPWAEFWYLVLQSGAKIEAVA